MTVKIKTDAEEELLTVICMDTYGNALTQSIEGGEAHFTGLLPNSQYKINVTMEGFHKLTGSVSGSYTTAQEIRIIDFTAKNGITDGSVVGYKYFDFTKTYGKKDLKLEMNIVPQGVDASVEIWVVRPNSAEGGVKVGESMVSVMWPEKLRTLSIDVSSLAARNAREALFFVFKGVLKNQSICEIEDFKFASK